MQDTTGLSSDQLLQVLEISRLLAAAADLESLLHKIAEATCTLLQCERASLWLHDPKTNELFTTVLAVCETDQIRVAADTGIVGAAFNSNCIIDVPAAYQDPRFNPSSDRATGYLTRSLLAAPMLSIDGRPVGVIEAVNKTTMPFVRRDHELLQLLADQAGVAIQRKQLQQIALKAARMQKEVELAREVQQSLLPRTLPAHPGFDIARWARSASTTGGDCYDIWQLPDGRIGIFLADASGHGLAPALVVSQVRTVVRSLCDRPGPTPHPHEILSRVNHRLMADLDRYRFVTAFLGFLHADGSLDWQSAGQGPIVYRPAAGASIQLINPAVPPLNALEELPEDIPDKLRINRGGFLALSSDGIFEAFDPTGREFDDQRVLDQIEATQQQSASAAVEALVDAVNRWQQAECPTDDQTIVMIKAV
jgi:serine phosphatase RsbU (regulator of sigma subunit)